jgi:hypothetical protein
VIAAARTAVAEKMIAHRNKNHARRFAERFATPRETEP